jgi:cytidine deaminase
MKSSVQLLLDMDEERLHRLQQAAWEVREHSRLLGTTAVGCSVLTARGSIYVGCNVEHQFRSHDVHAEVNALSSMVAAGDSPALALFVAAERERFTPCGACLDWIFELGGPQCHVWVHSDRNAQPIAYTAHELMPVYPR